MMSEESATGAAQAPPSSGLPWRSPGFIAFFLAAGLGPLSSIALRFVPGHLERAGHSPALIGEVMAASTFGGIIALPIAGWLARRHLRAMLIGGAAVQGVGLAAAALAGSSPVALALSVAVMSVGTAQLDVGVLTGLIVLVPALRRAQLLAYYFAYVSLARNIVGSSVAEGVIGEWGFSAMCQLLAALAVAHMIFRALTSVPSSEERGEEVPRRDFFRDLTRPRVLVLLAVFVLLAAHFAAGESFLSALAARRDLGPVTPFFATYFAVLSVGRAACGHLVERIGRGPVTIVSALILAAVGGGLAEVSEPAGLLVLGAGTGLGHLLLWPALYSTFYDRIRGPGMTSAALSVALALAGFIAELGLGAAASDAGYRALYWGAAGAALLAAALTLPITRWMSPPRKGTRR